MAIIEMEQGGADWLQMRCGSCTASRVKDAIAKLQKKDSESAARRKYRRELVYERLNGRAFEHAVTDPMIWGIETEPQARVEYEMLTGNSVRQIGLAMHPSIKWFSASTDGLVGDDGILEIKCLGSLNHLEVLDSSEIPEEHHWQMLAGMACAERQWCDFVSFDPRMPEGLQLFVKRFPRNDALISGMELEVTQFLSEVERDVETLKQRAKEMRASVLVAE